MLAADCQVPPGDVKAHSLLAAPLCFSPWARSGQGSGLYGSSCSGPEAAAWSCSTGQCGCGGERRLRRSRSFLPPLPPLLPTSQFWQPLQLLNAAASCCGFMPDSCTRPFSSTKMRAKLGSEGYRSPSRCKNKVARGLVGPAFFHSFLLQQLGKLLNTWVSRTCESFAQSLKRPKPLRRAGFFRKRCWHCGETAHREGLILQTLLDT